LDHYNVITQRLPETLSFYGEILDMRSGPTPSNDPRSAWLYDSGDRPILHVQSIDPAAPERKLEAVMQRLGGVIDSISLADLKGSGAIEHVALECSDYERVLQRLQARSVAFRTNEVPSIPLRQIFVKDPNGIVLELNFRQQAAA
jgi:catechol 2,3-dioxygenase-like lactoylglutathione lyase family enzyme